METRHNVVIYHVPGLKKVGCTKDLERRTREYRKRGYVGDLIVLEELYNVTTLEASTHEFLWADKFGYKKGWRYDVTERAVAASGVSLHRFGIHRPAALMRHAQKFVAGSPNASARKKMVCPFCRFVTSRVAMGAHIRRVHDTEIGTEKQLETRSVAYAEKAGCLHYKGAGTGKLGKPDRVFVTPNGYVWWVEFKVPGGKVAKLQVIESRRLIVRQQLHSFIDDFVTFIFRLDRILNFPHRVAPIEWECK